MVELPVKNTMGDIELFVRRRMEDLHIDADDEKEELTKEILTKSDTSFLWARLVLEELDGVYGHEGIRDVLRGIPQDMVSYYKRTVTGMEQNKREKHVAKAILQWAVLAARPLSVTEMTHALKLDIGTNLSNPKSAIEGLGGQLLTIDANSDQVHIVHATAREFLISEEAGEFTIRKHEDHSRIALTCLRLLTGPEMQPPRQKRLLEQKRMQRPHSPMLDYAISHFSDHVFSASVDSDRLLVALDKFLSLTVLTWIEKLVIAGDLHRLMETARNLKGHLDRRLKHGSPPNQHVSRIESWATDISRLATRFGSALRACPHSIYFLIPPLCPTETTVYKQFGKSLNGLTLLGLNNQHWDDCIATVNFEEDSVATVGCGGNLIAVGFESGALHLYNCRSYQREGEIPVDSPVDLICIDSEGLFIAVSGRRFVAVYDLHGHLRWKTKSRSRSILLTSSASVVVNVNEQGHMFQRDAETGEIVQEQKYTYQPPDYQDKAGSAQMKAPFHATISTNFELLALAYRNSPVSIFDLRSHELVGWAIDGISRAASHVIFNPDPEANLLLVAYNESHLALYDSWSGAQLHEHEAEQHIVYNSVTCSPEGRTFATIDIRGTLRIWDFRSLVELYHVVTPSHSFRILEFTSDALCLLDMIDQQMRVWSPSALVRQTEEEETSTERQAMTLPVIEGQYDKLQSSRIDAFCVHEKLPLVFYGTHQGDVSTYHCKTGEKSGTLYSHREGVRFVASSKDRLVASSDLLSAVRVWEFTTSPVGNVESKNLVLERQFSSAIHQLLFNGQETNSSSRLPTLTWCLIQRTGPLSDTCVLVLSSGLSGSG